MYKKQMYNFNKLKFDKFFCNNYKKSFENKYSQLNKIILKCYLINMHHTILILFKQIAYQYKFV